MSLEWDDREFLAGLAAAVPELKEEAKAGERERADQIASSARRHAHRAAVHDPREPVLADSIEVTAGRDVDGDYFEVGTSVPHGFYQEFGDSKTQAHPFMRPAVEENV